MGDEDQLKVIEEVCQRLEVSQELIEKAAFDTINQQDRIAQTVNTSMTYIMEMLSEFEMLVMEMEVASQELDETISFPLKKVNVALTNQSSIVEEIAKMYQTMIEQQNVLSEVLHNMESEIANHRDSMELAEELLLQNV